MKKALVLIVLTVFRVSGFSQQTPDDLIKTFFKEYEKDPVGAVENLYNTNNWIGKKSDDLAKVKAGIKELTPSFVGEYYDHQLINQKEIGGFLILYSYVLKYDRQPIRFQFMFYKPKDKWVLFNFKFDSDIDDELKEAAKLYNSNNIH